jgi:hypothetical protein
VIIHEDPLAELFYMHVKEIEGFDIKDPQPSTDNTAGYITTSDSMPIRVQVLNSAKKRT